MSVVIIGGLNRMVSQCKMARCAVAGAERSNAEIVRCHIGSGSALNEILLDETPDIARIRVVIRETGCKVIERKLRGSFLRTDCKKSIENGYQDRDLVQIQMNWS